MATRASSDLSLTLVASFLARLAEKAEARGLTDEDFRNDGLADKIVDLLSDGRKPANGYPVTVNYRQSLKDMIQAGRYDWVNPDITEEHFPVNPPAGGSAEVVIELIHFHRVMYSDDMLSELDRRGLRPATLPELLAFGARYPEKQREFLIFALGSVWRRWSDRRLVPCLWSVAGGRSLSLLWLYLRWDERYRFAAVRK